jgi:hypothetical protein
VTPHQYWLHHCHPFLDLETDLDCLLLLVQLTLQLHEQPQDQLHQDQ